jgi:Protein of unknown function (DUF3006)
VDDKIQSAMQAMYGGGSPSGMGGDQMEGPQAQSRMPRGPIVDQINDDVAVLMMPDGSTKEIPTSQLPPGTREGQTLGGNDDDAFADEQTARIRKRLSEGDDGGPLQL